MGKSEGKVERKKGKKKVNIMGDYEKVGHERKKEENERKNRK